MILINDSVLGTSSSVSDAERIERFLDPKVQSLLKVLTGRDFTRIFRNRKVGQKLHSPKVSFMTEEGLEETIQEAERRADALLQMPPVLLPKDDKEKVLAFDPRIQGHDESAFVFTDISLGSTNRVITLRFWLWYFFQCAGIHSRSV